MARKKVHPAESKAPPADRSRTLNPPTPSPGPTPAGAPFPEQDPQRRLGAYEGKGEHPRQQQMGNKD
jgi:hypothetical protein